MILRAAACLYALGVAMACPVALHAADLAPAEPAAPAETAAPATPADAKTEPPPAAPVPEPSQAPEPAPAATALTAAPARTPSPTPRPAKVPATAPVAVKTAGSVSMRDFSFAPGAVTIQAGQSVTWVNSGKAPHNATGDGFATPTVKSGGSASHTFPKAGTFSYSCTIHPQMKGTVAVVAAQQGGSGSDGNAGASGGDSGSGATGSSSGSSGSASSGSSSTASGPQLAATGLDAWLLGAAGVVLLSAGLALRRRSVLPGER